MILWLLLNSLGLVAVSIALYLILRQTGFILRRAGPGGNSAPSGPRVGENLSFYLSHLWKDARGERAKLVVFGSESCSICARIKQGAPELARRWRHAADIFLIYDCEQGTDASDLQALPNGLFFKHDCDLRKRLDTTFVPFGIVMNYRGIVVGKALADDISQLQNLLELEQSQAS